jgi:hypothetical protein
MLPATVRIRLPNGSLVQNMRKICLPTSKYVALVSGLAIACALFAPPAMAMNSDQLTTEVSLQQRPGQRQGEGTQYSLHIRLKNNGPTLLSIYEPELPWGRRESIVIVAVLADGTNAVMKESDYIHDPNRFTLELKPGEITEGQVPLNVRFEDLPDVVEKHDVIIFWSYQLQLKDGKRLKRQGGWLLIPKEKEKMGSD